MESKIWTILSRTWKGLPPFYRELSFFLMLTTLTWLIGNKMTVVPFTADNLFVSNALCTLFVVQTVALYYFFGRWVFPRYLYSYKLLPFLVLLIVSFLIIYWSNYVIFDVLTTFSERVGPTGLDVWIIRINRIFQQAGWLGIFSGFVPFYLNFSFSFEWATIYLAIKAFQDILTFQKRKLTLEKENLALELGFLKSQINPHLLFNTLNSIYARTLEVNEEASEMIQKLGDLMRYSLYYTGKDKVLLADEFTYIQNYIDLETNRHTPGMVDISFNISGKPDQYVVAPLLLIPFVENAFKHGVNKSVKPSYVRISALIENSILYFSVENSIPEKQAFPSISEHSGLGQTTTRKRLELIYSSNHELSLRETTDGYEVFLRIPLKKK